jgi:hypothetical protein
MTDLLADLGRLAWDPFWMPITAWTLLAACALAVMAFVPAREVFVRRDLHFALLLALPAGLVASKLLGGMPGASLLRTWWQGPALVAPVSPPEMTVSPVFEPDPVGIVSIGVPVLEPSIDPASGSGSEPFSRPSWLLWPWCSFSLPSFACTGCSPGPRPTGCCDSPMVAM